MKAKSLRELPVVGSTGNSDDLLAIQDGKAVRVPVSMRDKYFVDKTCPAFAESGAVVTCQPVEGYPLEVVSHIVPPTQSGSGTPSPDNVRPITGYETVKLSRTGKNLFGGDALADAITAKGGTKNEEAKTVAFPANLGGTYTNIFTKFKPNTQYTFIIHGKVDFSSQNLCVWYTEELSSGVRYERLSNFPAVNVDGDVIYTSRAGKTIAAFGTIYFDAGTTTLNYNQCGVFEGVLTKEDFEPYRGNTFTIDLGQTVYSGTFNWSTGELTMTSVGRTITALSSMQTAGYGNIALGQNALPTNYGTTVAWKSSHYNGALFDAKYPNYNIYAGNASGLVIIDKTHMTSLAAANAYLAEQKAAGTPVQVWYKLRTPVTVQLTPQEILALAGTNKLCSSTGDTEASGRANPAAIIKTLTERVAALEAAAVNTL